MKAIVLGAGQGTRLAPLTADRPKCMVELWGRSLLAHQLETFQTCGITDVVVVTGHAAHAVTLPGVRTRHNPHYDRTNMVASLFCAGPELRGDVIVSYGDIVFESRLLSALIAHDSDFAIVADDGWEALWALRMDDLLADAETLTIDRRGHVIELGKRPRSRAEIESQYIGLFKISGRVIGAVTRLYRMLDRRARYDGQPFEQMFMTSFIQYVIDWLMPVSAVRVRHGWVEVDTLRDLECYAGLPFRRPELFALPGLEVPAGGLAR